VRTPRFGEVGLIVPRGATVLHRYEYALWSALQSQAKKGDSVITKSPFACTFTDAELERRNSELLDGVLREARSVEPLTDG
jgi:hypothetical protein